MSILFVGPVAALATGWFVLESYPGHPGVILSPIATYGLWVMSMAVGLIGVWILPIRPLFRAVLVPPYLAAMWAACFALLAVLDCATLSGCR